MKTLVKLMDFTISKGEKLLKKKKPMIYVTPGMFRELVKGELIEEEEYVLWFQDIGWDNMHNMIEEAQGAQRN